MLTPRTRSLILGMLAADLAVLVYLNALHNPFVYDDLIGVVRNSALVDGGGLGALLRQNVFRPVVSLSFALDHALWGLAPPGYHVTSVLLHAVNAALVFVLARRAVDDWRARDAGVTLDGDVLAFVTAALFAVHPMMTEAVGYVSGRGDVLAATLALLALLTLRRGLTEPAWRAPGVALAVAAAATKEVAVVVVAVLFVWDRLLLDGDSLEKGATRRLVSWHLPVLGVAVLLGLARLAAFFLVERSTTSGAAGPALQAQPGVALRYLVLLLAPVGQSLVHFVRPVTSPLDWRALLETAALALLGVAAWRDRRRHPLTALGVAWFLLFLAPAAVVALHEPMAERRVYLASVGVFLLVGFVGAYAWQSAGRRGRVAAVTAFAVALAALGSLTLARNLVWRDAITLWSDAARKAPAAWSAHAGLATALAEQGRCAEALPVYETALRLRERPEVYSNYGICLAAQRRLPEATRAFEHALALDPGYAMAHHNLGLVALRMHDVETAHAHFVRAVSMRAGDAWWRQSLIRIYELEIRDPAKMLELCRAIVRVAGRETPGALACLERYERRAGAAPGRGP
ncbi:MAG TPA: tetratricopeptide repeat protein [Candidatus Binatia bacterium]|nr:tetratricopeptide repeat protein [Candidatus Binatia bacterium]